MHARLGGGSLALATGLDGLERVAHEVRSEVDRRKRLGAT